MQVTTSKLLGLLRGQRLGRDLAVLDRAACRPRARAAAPPSAAWSARSMPSTSAPRRAIESARMPPPQPTSSTRLPRSGAMRVDPVQAQRVDLVQRPELAFRVPPAVGELAELGQFARIGVDGHRHVPMLPSRKTKSPAEAGLFDQRARARSLTCRGCRPLRFRRDGSSRGLRRSCCRRPAASRPCLRCRRGSSRCPCSTR